MDKIKLYVRESMDELLHKVNWPTWEELQSTTTIVMVSSILFSLVVFLIDFLFGANPENVYFKGLLYYIYSFMN